MVLDVGDPGEDLETGVAAGNPVDISSIFFSAAPLIRLSTSESIERPNGDGIQSIADRNPK